MAMRLFRRTIAGLLVCAATLAAAQTRADEINLYSTREPQLVAPVIAAFTNATGIKINLIFIEDNLVKRLSAEGASSPADVLMTIGLDKTSQFAMAGLTQTIGSPVIDAAVPAPLRDRNGHWIGLSVRPRVVMMRTDVALDRITYEDLADPTWRGKLCMRSPLHQNNVALIAAFLLHHGADKAEAWLRGLKANLVHAPKGKDNDVVGEIGKGSCAIGIANTVALAQLQDGREGADWAEWAGRVKTVPTGFENGGAHVNITGAAVAKYAPHRDAAVRFLEFLLTPDAQTLYAAAELEVPMTTKATPHPLVAAMGSFPIDSLPVDQIASTQKAAIALIRKVGFDE